MRISDIDITTSSDSCELTATVNWEQRPTEPFALHVRTGNAPPMSRDQAGNALLCALFPIAFHDREARLAVDAPACPMLADNLATVLGWWNKWSKTPPLDMKIECRGAEVVSPPRIPATAFLSGGVDSFHMLFRNRKLHARGTPAAIETAIIVHGFDVGRRKRDAENALFERVHSRIGRIAADDGIKLTSVSTNLRHMKHTPGYWFDRFFGAACIAMGHAIVPGFGYLQFAGTHDIENLSPIGSNPAVDVQFSSQRLQVMHEGIRFSRLDKVRELLEWPLALDNLRVCAQEGREQINCGVCEKCLRTRLELLAAGRPETQSLGPSEFDPSLLDPIEIANDYQAACYRDAARALAGGPNDILSKAAFERVRLFEASNVNLPGS